MNTTEKYTTTIRKGVFETNSSSTHSLVIQTKGVDNYNLVEDNILYLDNLHSLTVEGGEYGTDVTVCRDFNSKLALLLLIVYHYYENEDYEDNYDVLLDLIKNRYDYKDIVKSDRSIYVEDEDIEYDPDPIKMFENLSDYFEMCEDEDKEFVHKYERY